MSLGKPPRAMTRRMVKDAERQQSREVGKQKVSELVVIGTGGGDLHFLQRTGVPPFRD